VWHQRGRDDGIARLGLGAPQKPIEEFAPFLHYEPTGRIVADLPGHLTLGVSVNDQQLAVACPAPPTRLLQLARVEASVAATSNDHNVAENNAI
jgi:hypothetical protein